MGISIPVIGDSITEGWGAPPGCGWVDRANQVIREARPETGIVFHGLGRFGSDSGAGPAGWGRESAPDWRPGLAAFRPGAVAVMLATNDCQAIGGNLGGMEFAGSLEKLIARLRGHPGMTRVPVLLVIPPEPGVTVVDPGGWAAYAVAHYAAAALAGRCRVINLAAAGGPGLRCDDVHPSPAGHAAIGEAVALAAAGLAAWISGEEEPPPPGPGEA